MQMQMNNMAVVARVKAKQLPFNKTLELVCVVLQVYKTLHASTTHCSG